MRFTLWGLHDHPVDPGSPLSGLDNWSHFGLLRADGTPKPALTSFEKALIAPLDCAAVGRAAGAPPGWTPLVQASNVVVASPFVRAHAGVETGLPDSPGSSSVTVTAAGSAKLQQAIAVAHSSMRPRLLRLGRTKGRWWVSVRTSTAARIGVVVDRVAVSRAPFVRRISPPSRARVGTRRIAIGRLRAGTRFRVRVMFHPLHGAAIGLTRTFRSPS